MIFDRPEALDFAKMIRELQDRKVSLSQIGMHLGGLSKNTVYSWATGAVPNHPDGEALKALHIKLCGTSTAEAA